MVKVRSTFILSLIFLLKKIEKCKEMNKMEWVQRSVWPPDVAKAIIVYDFKLKRSGIIIYWTPKSVEEFKRVTPNNNRRSRGHNQREKKWIKLKQ